MKGRLSMAEFSSVCPPHKATKWNAFHIRPLNESSLLVLIESIIIFFSPLFKAYYRSGEVSGNS